MLKGIEIKKDKREFLSTKKSKKKINKKISLVIKNILWSEKTLMHKAERPSN